MRQSDDDTTSESAQREKPSHSRRWIPHTVWAGIVVIPFLAWMAVLSRSQLAPGQCSGIGWGCSLAGWDAVGFGLIFIGLPLLLVLLAGHLIIGVTQRVRSPRKSG